jgi:hypothetical protein
MNAKMAERLDKAINIIAQQDARIAQLEAAVAKQK